MRNEKAPRYLPRQEQEETAGRINSLGFAINLEIFDPEIQLQDAQHVVRALHSRVKSGAGTSIEPDNLFRKSSERSSLYWIGDYTAYGNGKKDEIFLDPINQGEKSIRIKFDKKSLEVTKISQETPEYILFFLSYNEVVLWEKPKKIVPKIKMQVTSRETL